MGFYRSQMMAPIYVAPEHLSYGNLYFVENRNTMKNFT